MQIVKQTKKTEVATLTSGKIYFNSNITTVDE